MIGFITGLPRSRTKWFAEYFNSLVTAYHEPLNGMTDKQQFYDLVQSKCLISDSGLYITDFQQRYPNVPTVIIERDLLQVYSSLCNVIDNMEELHSIFLDLLLKQKKQLDKLDGMRVPYSQINEKLETIHKYLKIPFDQDHADRMTATNVQVSEITVNIKSIKSYQLWVSNH